MKKTVAALVIKNNKILLVKRGHKPFQNYWALPGGHINKKESAKKAIIREVKEETNLVIKPKFFAEDYERFKKIKWYAHVYIFKCSAKVNIKFNKKEIKNAKYFPLNKLPKNMAFNHERVIKERLIY